MNMHPPPPPPQLSRLATVLLTSDPLAISKTRPIQPSSAYLFATKSSVLYSGGLNNKPLMGLGIALNFNYSAGHKRH